MLLKQLYNYNKYTGLSSYLVIHAHNCTNNQTFIFKVLKNVSVVIKSNKSNQIWSTLTTCIAHLWACATQCQLLISATNFSKGLKIYM